MNIYERFSWVATILLSDMIDEGALDNKMSLKAYQQNSQWGLLEVTVANKTRTTQTDTTNEFDYLEFTLKMKRKRHFFVYTIVFPCMCLTCKL